MGKKLKPTSRVMAYFPKQFKRAVAKRGKYSDPAKGKKSFFQGMRDYVKGLRKL